MQEEHIGVLTPHLSWWNKWN